MAGFPAEDFLPAERALTPEDVPDAWETISLYSGDGSRIEPLEKHVVPNGKILFYRPEGMSLFRSFGGMFQAASLQIFGQDMEAGKVMGLAPYEPDESTSRQIFFDSRWTGSVL